MVWGPLKHPKTWIPFKTTAPHPPPVSIELLAIGSEAARIPVGHERVVPAGEAQVVQVALAQLPSLLGCWVVWSRIGGLGKEGFYNLPSTKARVQMFQSPNHQSKPPTKGNLIRANWKGKPHGRKKDRGASCPVLPWCSCCPFCS